MTNSMQSARDFIPCAECSYWIPKEQPTCLNCGLPAGQTEDEVQRPDRRERLTHIIKASLIWALVTLLIFLGSVAFLGIGIVSMWAAICTGISLLLSGSAWGIRRLAKLPPEGAQSPRTESGFPEFTFKHREAIAHRRVITLKKKLQRLASVEGRTGAKHPDSVSTQMTATVSKAKDMVTEQIQGYMIALCEVDLLRWINQLESSFIPRLNDSIQSYDDAEAAARALEAYYGDGQRKALKWTAELDLDNRHAANCIQLFEETLATLDRVRERIRQQQAALAVAEVAPTKNLLEAEALSSDLLPVDRFNMAQALDGWRDDFEALEMQYHRLELEDEVVKGMTG